ncbi:MAG: hypothetical protein NUV97_02755 [archaeon]|nr:hypothetical protein [archaeon]
MRKMKKKMKRGIENDGLSSPQLNILRTELEKIERADGFLKEERRKLMKDKGKLVIKMEKEKEIIRLKDKIKKVRSGEDNPFYKKILKWKDGEAK